MENEMIVHNQSEVASYNLCTHLRAFSDVSLTSEKGTAFDNAVIFGLKAKLTSAKLKNSLTKVLQVNLKQP